MGGVVCKERAKAHTNFLTRVATLHCMKLVLKRSWIKNVGVFCIALLACFVVVELGFRVFAPQALFDNCNKKHPDWPRPMIISDETLGWTMKPNGEWCLYQPDTNKKITIKTNSKGMRGTQEYTVEKPPNTFRILVYGDSFLWGENLFEDEHFATQFQKQLEKEFAKSTVHLQPEVLAFGVDAYGMHQSFLKYATDGIKYNADLVIYLLYQNDFTDHMVARHNFYPKPKLQFTQKTQGNDNAGTIQLSSVSADTVARIARAQRQDTNYYKLYKNDNNKPVPRISLLRRAVLGHSHFVVFLRKTLQANPITSLFHTPYEKDFFRLLEKISVTNKVLFQVRQQYDPSFMGIIENANYVLHFFNKAVKEQGSQFILVNVPSVYQVQSKYYDKLRRDFTHIPEGALLPKARDIIASQGLTLDSAQGNILLGRIAAQESLHYVDLTTPAKKHEYTFYHRADNHWSPAGTAISAEYITQQLQAKGLLPFVQEDQAKV